jgi:hypothetical protein
MKTNSHKQDTMHPKETRAWVKNRMIRTVVERFEPITFQITACSGDYVTIQYVFLLMYISVLRCIFSSTHCDFINIWQQHTKYKARVITTN